MGHAGVDEIYRCVDCCRPFEAKAVAKMLRQREKEREHAAKNEAALAEDAPVLELDGSGGGFDMSELVEELGED